MTAYYLPNITLNWQQQTSNYDSLLFTKHNLKWQQQTSNYDNLLFKT